MTQLTHSEDTELREALRHVYGTCACDSLDMHCFYWSSNDPDFIDTLPERQLDKVMQLITEKQLALLDRIEQSIVQHTTPEGAGLVTKSYVANTINFERQQLKGAKE